MIVLRQWRPEDAPGLARAANSEGVAYNLREGFPQPYTEENARAFIAACRECEGHTNIERAIEADGKIAGTVGIRLKAQKPGEAVTGELGYWLDKDCRGKGVMTFAVENICRQAFEENGVAEITAEVFERNRASVRVLEKNGFSFSGEAFCRKDGETLRVLRFSLSRTGL